MDSLPWVDHSITGCPASIQFSTSNDRGVEMYHPHFLKILMLAREHEILEEVRRGGYHARRRRGGAGLSKKIARRLLSALIRLKAIAGPRQIRQQAADVKERRFLNLMASASMQRWNFSLRQSGPKK